MRTVLVYRHQLFRVSEGFIGAQAESLRRHRALYAGRRTEGPPPEGARVVTLKGVSACALARHVLWRDPSPLLARLAGEKPALVHAHFGVEGVYALPLAGRLGVPLITTFHGFDATLRDLAFWSSRKPSWMNYALWRSMLARRGDLFLCVSDHIRRCLIARGFPPERTRTHYIGIDTDRVRPDLHARRPGLILHVARLVEKKGTAGLLEAFARVAAAVPRAELVIIGTGPLRGSLEARARRLGIGERVRFLGARPRTEVLDWMKRAAVVCQPSLTARSGDQEGLPTVLIEAAACGTPVVASRAGGMLEAVREPDTGLLVPEQDVPALAEALGRVLQDDPAARRMGLAARDWVETRFRLAHQTEELEGIYEGLS